MGKLVESPEDIPAIWQRDEWPRLTGGDVTATGDLLALHVHLVQLQGGRAGCFQGLLAGPLVGCNPGIFKVLWLPPKSGQGW